MHCAYCGITALKQYLCLHLHLLKCKGCVGRLLISSYLTHFYKHKLPFVKICSLLMFIESEGWKNVLINIRMCNRVLQPWHQNPGRVICYRFPWDLPMGIYNPKLKQMSKTTHFCTPSHCKRSYVQTCKTINNSFKIHVFSMRVCNLINSGKSHSIVNSYFSQTLFYSYFDKKTHWKTSRGQQISSRCHLWNLILIANVLFSHDFMSLKSWLSQENFKHC